MSRAVPGALIVALALALTGCQPGAGSGGPASPRATQAASSTGLADGGGGERTGPASTVLSTPRPTLSTPGAVAEAPGSCPYISAADFAQLEGDRVGQVTVLQSRPAGCRFYFAFDPAVVVGEITVARFPTATQAYNAMVGSAQGHPEVQSEPGIGAGAVAFTTPLQGSPSWQCVFAKGASVVTVRTRQPYPALNAFNLARAIAPKIK
ncbi:MAG TPA: hypothetical protein VGB75_06550 [Jatrophihabitans sp.]|uniref:hypothetical protein n=1 Tax=Jatrophihabitans sp. TaxID=1932789 RepID=UPI002F1E0B57